MPDNLRSYEERPEGYLSRELYVGTSPPVSLLTFDGGRTYVVFADGNHRVTIAHSALALAGRDTLPAAVVYRYRPRADLLEAKAFLARLRRPFRLLTEAFSVPEGDLPLEAVPAYVRKKLRRFLGGPTPGRPGPGPSPNPRLQPHPPPRVSGPPTPPPRTSLSPGSSKAPGLVAGRGKAGRGPLPRGPGRGEGATAPPSSWLPRPRPDTAPLL